MKRKKHKTKTHQHKGIAIRELRPEGPGGGGGYYLVDRMTAGRRERRGFDTLARAKTYCELLDAKLQREGTSALSLTPAQRADAHRALKLLDGQASLADAAAAWLARNGRDGSLTVAELGQKWLAALKVQGCRPTTLRERAHKVSRLSAQFGSRTAASMTRAEITDWLAANWAGATWDGYRRAYRAMFEFAVAEKLLEANPIVGIKAIRTDERLPAAMSAATVTRLLRAAEQWTPQLVPTLAVQFFGGLRPGEALGLQWENVNFKDCEIRVMPETSKMRRTRIVEFDGQLAAWLAPYRKPAGPVGISTPAQFDYLMRRKPIGPDYEQAGVPIAKRQPDARPRGLLNAASVKWIQDGPRKTFASAHYAVHKDAAKLAALLGHTGGHDILFRHYRSLLSPKEGARLFEIMPAATIVLRADFQRGTA